MIGTFSGKTRGRRQEDRMTSCSRGAREENVFYKHILCRGGGHECESREGRLLRDRKGLEAAGL